MKWKILFLSILAAMSIFAANAQSPMPVIIPANSPVAAASPSAPGNRALPNSDALQSAIQMLEKMKAANDDLLRKQEATLQQLDELQKAAEQMKIFSKRG